MKRTFLKQWMKTGLALPMIALLAAAITPGTLAPNFTAAASNGKNYSLATFRGQYVVLEWHNNGCPYTRKHYESGNMQKLQRKWTAKGVTWFTVISSAPGNQGYVNAADENAYLTKMNASPTAALLDPMGSIGHLYDAKTTPGMVVIALNGKVIYEGAIDDHPTPDVSDIPNSKNYVDAALTEALAGKPVADPATHPYGCSVKYPGVGH